MEPSLPYLPLATPDISEAAIADVVECLRSGWLTTGKRAAQFEAACAEYLGAKHVVAVSSCTAALHLSLIGAGVTAGSEVITTPVTWPATSNVIHHIGATPRFVDVEADTANMDVALVEAAISEKTSAIMPVHLAGQPCDLGPLREIASRHGLPLIEDAAQAIGSSYDGVKIGATGTACFSFYATKNTTTGEGGLITTDDQELAARVRLLSRSGVNQDAWNRESGENLHWELIEPGFKANLPDVLAAIGVHQIARVEEFNTARAALVEHYDHLLAPVPGIERAPIRPGRTSAHHLYMIQVDKELAGVSRDELMHGLRRANIGCGVHFRSTHLQPYYRDTLGMAPEAFPTATYLADRLLSLPLFPTLGVDGVERVVAATLAVLDR